MYKFVISKLVLALCFFVQGCFGDLDMEQTRRMYENKIGPYVMYVDRISTGKGFHRQLIQQYSMIIFDDIRRLPQHYFMVIEHLPSGIYADPEEILKFEYEGVQYYFKDKVNIEAPAYKSGPVDVYMFFLEGLVYETVVPIHLRYQKPHECLEKGYYKNISLHSPTMYYRDANGNTCNETITAPCDSTNKKSCTWNVGKVVSNVTMLEFSVPVGCTEHQMLVTFVTFSVVIAGSIFLCHAVLRNKKESLKGIKKD